MTKIDKIRLVFIALLAALLLLDGALGGYLLWPGKGDAASRRAKEQELRQELISRNQKLTPLKGIDKKLVDTRAAIKSFYGERIASEWSQISKEIHGLAQQNGITLLSIRYKADDSDLPGVQQVNIETGVIGDYVKIAHFVNAVERDKVLFLIDQVSVSGQPAGNVQLQIKFRTYLKATT